MTQRHHQEITKRNAGKNFTKETWTMPVGKLKELSQDLLKINQMLTFVSQQALFSNWDKYQWLVRSTSKQHIPKSSTIDRDS